MNWREPGETRVVENGPGLPLAGMTVVELGTSVAAPTAAQILAELGAEVIKVENPVAGDDARSWGPPFVDGSAGPFVAINRNKKSAAIDLKDKPQRDALHRFIIERVDIVLQNLRAGVVESFKLDAASLTAEKPSLVYCNLTAFGTEGPLAGKPGYDPLMQAFGGLMSVTGLEGHEPVRVGPAIIDQGSALWMVVGILAALNRRHSTGKGGVIEGSLYETALWWMNVHVANYHASGKVPRRIGSENMAAAPYKAFEAADGWIVIAVGNDAQFARFARAFGHPEWIEDPEFLTNPDRSNNRARLNTLVSDITKTRPRQHWVDLLDQAGVPCAPQLRLDEVLAHPQSKATGVLQTPPDGGIAVMGIPLKFEGKRPDLRNSAPRLGNATDVVLGPAARGKAAE
jgi:crotonobetainyl-CoA:carnitine CoA-transferase CaiB-like acyl-CoA transferase